MHSVADLVRIRTRECSAAAPAVLAMSVGEPHPTRAGDHVGTCLRCQAEVAAFRRALDSVGSMPDSDSPVPADLLPDLLEALHGEDVDLPGWAVRAACVGGLTAAGMIVWRGRRFRQAG